MKKWLREKEKESREECLLLERAMAGNNKVTRSFATSCLVVTPVGIPLIWDPAEARDNRRPLWKFPGGKGEPGETPVEGIIREVKEEIGISLDPKDLVMLRTLDRGDHDKIFFRANSPARTFNATGDEGERIGVFSAECILMMKDFFSPHRNALGNELWALSQRAAEQASRAAYA